MQPASPLLLLLSALMMPMPLLAATGDAGSATAIDEPLEEVIITALEPRYVEATRRDRIGRIWAPVYINDQGPFRLVLDTGASHTVVMPSVASALNLSPNQNSTVMLRGVTGSAVIPTINVKSLRVGDLLLTGKRLPIVTDALGGAEGVLGTEGLADKRVHIDFRRDLIMITRSHKDEHAPEGFITIPVKFSHGNLLTVDARIGSVRLKAIIDTGGEATIANLATRDALARRLRDEPRIGEITGATAHVEKAEGYATPPVEIGDILIRSPQVSFGDLKIFHHWKLTSEPAILIGMDVLGQLDTLIIDYQRAELQVKMRSGR